MALSVRQLSKSFTGVTVLAHMDLEIAAGEIHGLVGENGSGKSTLIKVLAGYHEPDGGGEVFVSGSPLSFGSPPSSYSLGCRFVHQDLGLFEDMSVMDNILLNTGFPTRRGTIRERECRRTVSADLRRVGLSLSPDLLISDLRPAEKTGVAVAKALRPDPVSAARVLVLDEPTATLPESEVERLLVMVRAVAASGVGVLYVTHRLAEIFALAANVTVLRSGHKVATQAVAGLTRAEVVNLMVGHEFEVIGQEAAANVVTLGPQVLEVDNVSVGSIKNISFTVKAGELVGVAGITGSGAESLLASLFGATGHSDPTIHQSGTVTVNGEVLVSKRPDRSVAAGVAYMPPDRKISGGILDHSARENLTISSLQGFSSRFRLRHKEERVEVEDWFQKLSVRPVDGSENALATFSGGNQQKVLFAKWLRLNPSVFLLDEPTQGVDVGAKALLHRQLLTAVQTGMAILVSSTDLDELVVLCQRVMVMRGGVVVADLRGRDVSVPNISRASLGTTHESVA
jgi:ribose transport system ATP-binding protein